MIGGVQGTFYFLDLFKPIWQCKIRKQIEGDNAGKFEYDYPSGFI